MLINDFDYYLEEINRKFEGWDFSYLKDRLVESVKQWSYHSKIIPYLLRSQSLLDMGTGGGEFLSKLPIPKITYATESYSPNIPIAQARLEPLGINVIPLQDDNNIPIPDGECDLIINRHECYNPNEIKRILKPKGYFITQQVGNEDCLNINKLLKAPLPKDYDPNWTVDFLANQLEQIGLNIETQLTSSYNSRLFDVGALIYFLKAISWQVPDFSIEKYKTQLREIHQKIQLQGFIDITTQRYMIIAQKL